MMKYYQFAGVEIAISIPERWMYEEEQTLGEFQVSQLENPHKFQYEIVEQLEPPIGKLVAMTSSYCIYEWNNQRIRYIGSVESGWEHAYIRAFHCEKKHYVQLKLTKFIKAVGIKTVLNSLETEHLIVEAGGIILHASYIEWNGNAILFTAPSETGKSTQADLWEKCRGAEIINGDRAVIRIVDGTIMAAGIPFAGSSKFCKNRTLPLAAIVYLQQAPRTTIQQLRGISAFRRVWEGCTVNTWSPQDVNRASDIVKNIVEMIPIYQLSCTPDESAVIALEEKLEGNG